MKNFFFADIVSQDIKNLYFIIIEIYSPYIVYILYILYICIYSHSAEQLFIKTILFIISFYCHPFPQRGTTSP